MISTIHSGALLGDSSDQRSGQGQDQQDGRRPPEPQKTAQPDIRLLIEPDETGVLTYKLVDRTSGAVMSVVTRDELLKMVSDPDYKAGRVISTHA
jgi:hypothetical protein